MSSLDFQIRASLGKIRPSNSKTFGQIDGQFDNKFDGTTNLAEGLCYATSHFCIQLCYCFTLTCVVYSPMRISDQLLRVETCVVVVFVVVEIHIPWRIIDQLLRVETMFVIAGIHISGVVIVCCCRIHISWRIGGQLLRVEACLL